MHQNQTITHQNPNINLLPPNQTITHQNPKEIIILISGAKIPDYEKQNLPEGKDELLLTIFVIQGLVLCKSGSQYFPLEGNLYV